jgi:hypothetical protein
MNSASYRVVPSQSGYAIEHEGRIEGSYATREAAFEAIVAPASNAIKDGLAVAIEIPRTPSRPAN